MVRSHVVTGGGRGIGRAVAERLLADGDAVVVLDRDEAALGWTSAHPAGLRVIPLAGNAADEAVTGRAADLAQGAGKLAGWVNNAAVFRDAWLDAVPAAEVTALHPLGRPGRPREAADAVRYLLSDEASFINGTVLAVDGGRSALGLDPEQAP